MQDRRSAGFWTEYGLVVKAAGVALVLVAMKAAIVWADLSFVSTLPLLTGLMGAVVFTLAILLAGVLADFKESERLVSELASEIERLDQDMGLAVREPTALARAREHVRTLAARVHATLRAGQAVRMRDLKVPLQALDDDLEAVALGNGPPNYVILARSHVAATARMLQRLEGIVETTFVRSAYAIAGVVVAFALGVFALTDIQPVPQALVLYGFGAFLLVGLFLLIEDLDNPFAGHARVDLTPLAKLEARLASTAVEARLPVVAK